MGWGAKTIWFCSVDEALDVRDQGKIVLWSECCVLLSSRLGCEAKLGSLMILSEGTGRARRKIARILISNPKYSNIPFLKNPIIQSVGNGASTTEQQLTSKLRSDYSSYNTVLIELTASILVTKDLVHETKQQFLLFYFVVAFGLTETNQSYSTHECSLQFLKPPDMHSLDDLHVCLSERNATNDL